MISAIALSSLETLTIQIGSYIMLIIYAVDPEKDQMKKTNLLVLYQVKKDFKRLTGVEVIGTLEYKLDQQKY